MKNNIELCYERFYIVILYYLLLISKTEKSLCCKKVRVFFSNNFLQLGIYYYKQPEKPRNLKRCISWKMFTKKFKKSIALKLLKAD